MKTRGLAGVWMRTGLKDGGAGRERRGLRGGELRRLCLGEGLLGCRSARGRLGLLRRALRRRLLRWWLRRLPRGRNGSQRGGGEPL